MDAIGGAQLPVWLTVIVARFVGGFLAGLLTVVLLVAVVFHHTQAAEPTETVSTGVIIGFLLGGAVIVALITGAVLMFFLPKLSSVRVRFLTAVTACFVGQLVPSILGLMLAHATLPTVYRSSPSDTTVLLDPAGGLAAIGLWVLGVVVTAWMIQTESGGPTKRSDDAYRRYLDRVAASESQDS